MDPDEVDSKPDSIPSGASKADVAPESRLPQSRRRLWPWLLGVPLLVTMAAALGAGSYLVRSVNRRLAEAISAADRDHPSWRIDDLMAHRTPVPDAENSALVVAKAVSQLPENWPADRMPLPGQPRPAPTAIEEACDRVSETADNVRLDDVTAEAIRSELNTYHEAVRLARTLVNYDRGRHELKLGPKLIDTLLPETQAARTVARLLAADAAVLAHDGDLDGALDSCRAILGVGRSIGDEPFLISHLVRVAIGTHAMKTTRRVLGQGEPSEAALARLQAPILDELAQPLIVHGLRGERAIMNELIRRLETGEMSVSALSDDKYEFNPDAPRASLAPWGSLLYKNQRAIAIEWMNELVAIGRQPAQRRPPLWKAWQAKVDRVKQSRFGPYTATLPLLLIPALSAADSALSRYQGELGTSAILLAAERHRRKHGDWPASIESLDTAILPDPPIDPYSGKPFRMERRNEQLLIYSIGPDLKDDHGAYDTRRWMKGGPDDVGTGAWDVAQRRQTSPPLSPRSQ